MSSWLDKSNESLKAANKLLEAALPNASVHSSYYSCVQYVFYVMEYFWGDEIKTIESNSHSKVNDVGTHVWIVKTVYKHIKNNCRPIYRTEARNIANDFNQLMIEMKEVRVNADYKYDLIKQEVATEVLSKAEKTIKLLKDYYEKS